MVKERLISNRSRDPGRRLGQRQRCLTGELWQMQLRAHAGRGRSHSHAGLGDLDLVSRDRLAEALSGYLGLPGSEPALLDRDLERIKNMPGLN